MARRERQQVRVCGFLGILLLSMMSGCALLERDKIRPPADLPIVNEISPVPMGNMPPWIELHNPTDTRVRIQDYSLVINDRFRYTLPRGVRAMPPKSFILLQFDGRQQRTVDYTFKDGLLVLHLPDTLRGAMEPRAGQIAVYARERLVGVVVRTGRNQAHAQGPPRPTFGRCSAGCGHLRRIARPQRRQPGRDAHGRMGRVHEEPAPRNVGVAHSGSPSGN